MHVTLKKVIEKVADKLTFETCCAVEYIEVSNIHSECINILALELNGYVEDFQEGQIQIIDNKGLNFLSSLEDSIQDKNLSNMFSCNIPAIIFTDGNVPNARFINLAEANNIPVLMTKETRLGVVKKLERVIEELLSPKIDYRGTMMEVYGLGVLIGGKSNVGKSECAIDLIQRGHRMIGDDLVRVTKRGEKVLVAKGKYPISNKMELRGIGIVDIVRLFGISAIKEIEKIELIVELEKWDMEKSYERLGLEEKRKEILGVTIPYVEIPVAPGRNTAILVEVAVMNYRLRTRGIIPAEELDMQVIESFKKIEED